MPDHRLLDRPLGSALAEEVIRAKSRLGRASAHRLELGSFGRLSLVMC
jgi:hypothetical protein